MRKPLDLGALYGMRALNYILEEINREAKTHYWAVELSSRGDIAINSARPATIDSPSKVREVWRGHLENAIPYFLSVYQTL